MKSFSQQAWQWLRHELDRWAEQNRQAAFWWRDDDAVAPTPALERLLALHHRQGVPLALATIPKGADSALADRLELHPGIAVLQHGYAHENHAGEGERAILVSRRKNARVVGLSVSFGLHLVRHPIGAVQRIR